MLLAVPAVLGGALEAASAAGVLGTGAREGGHVSVSAASGPPPAAAPPAVKGLARATAKVGTVVGLGDSVPAGSACDCRPYVSLIGEALEAEQGTPVQSRNLAVAGLTTQGLLDLLAEDETRSAVSEADLIVITVGANDFDSDPIADEACAPSAGLACYQDELARLRTGMASVLRQVHALNTRAGGRIVVTGYWNVFVDGAPGRSRGQEYVATSDALTRAVNATLAASAADAGVRYVDLYTPFNGHDGTRDDTDLLAADGDHPDATGHRLIADTILAALSRV